MTPSETGLSYCVIMRGVGSTDVRVVGPFLTQDAAVEWAQRARRENPHWEYTPDVMGSPEWPQ